MILILRALGLGDLLTAVPALRALRRAFPDRRRVLAAPASLEPLVRLIGAIDEVVDTAPLAPITVQTEHVSIAVNLHGRGPQSHWVLLKTRPRRLIAFAHDDVPETRGFPVWRSGEYEIDRWCRLLEENGITADATDYAIAVPYRDRRSAGAIVIHPGAASASRRWPAERWIKLCRRIHSLGFRTTITGSASEAPLCRRIAHEANVPENAMLAGKSELDTLAAIVAGACAVVCGDTGVAHIATAVRTPSVVLFGPTSPAEWGPPPNGLHRVLWRGTTGDPHAEHIDAGLARIGTGKVFAALQDVLAATVSNGRELAGVRVPG